MSVVYADSCVLLATYIQEKDSDLAAERLQAADLILTSSLTYAEVLAVLGRYKRERRIKKRRYEATCERFRIDWAKLVIVPLEVALPLIPIITRDFSLKAGDAIHLASAAVFADLTPNFEFLTFDRRLGVAALEKGFQLWPHPDVI